MFSVHARRQRRISRILAVLENEALTVLEINNAIGMRFGRWYRMSPGTLYPLLFQLENQKKIASFWKTGPYPRKRLYTPAKITT